MCDYSLASVKSRAAVVGDKLTVTNFGTGTRGFASSEASNTAVCVLPGTELAFEAPLRRATIMRNDWGGVYVDWTNTVQLKSKTAIFCQVDKDKPLVHHDAVQLPDDADTVLINHLCLDQVATVLQLPAAPKTEAEAEAQKRLDVVA